MMRTWAMLLGCACAALGFGLWEAGAQSMPEASPTRWTLGDSSVPLEVAQLAGGLRPSPHALDLWSYRTASPRLGLFGEGVVELTARVPADGQLVVRLGADSRAGPTRPVHSAGMAGPPPRGRPPAGNPVALPGLPPTRGVGLVIQRGASASDAGRGIVGRGIVCDAAPAPGPERFVLRLDVRRGEIRVSVDGQPVTRCRGSWGDGAVVLGSGVRRVQIESIAITPAGGTPFADDFGGPTRSPLFGGVLALIAGALGPLAARRANASSRAVRSLALAMSPLLALPLLGRVSMRAALDALRMLEVPESLGPLVCAGIPSALLLVVRAGGTAPSLGAAVRRGLVPLGVVALGILLQATGGLPRDAPGWAILSAVAIPLAGLAWVNTHPFPRRVTVSWALSLGILAAAEGGLRLTALGGSWSATAGWKRASEEFSELIEIRKYRSYPDEGFPVRPPDPDSSRRRIVALGGSSTGGAYQMDDLAQFWPQRLQERLAGTDWQVVNQGVGGWNTLHVRLYLESQIDRLDADVYVLYVGHNDILTPAPVPYRELYAGWRAPNTAARAISGTLHELRLYVGLKYAIFGLLGARASVAVPVQDARDNLGAITAIAQAQGAHVLLVNEGLNPDPYPMRPYGDMLATLASTTGSAYVDAAAAFAAEDPELFIDDCHLSVEGHARLAEWVHTALKARGWLE